MQNIYKSEQIKEEKDQALPSIAEGKTSPPKPFTDDTLLSSMENDNKAETDAEREGVGKCPRCGRAFTMEFTAKKK